MTSIHAEIWRDDGVGYSISQRESFSWRRPLRRIKVTAVGVDWIGQLEQTRWFVTHAGARRWAWKHSGYSYAWGPSRD